MGGELFAAGGNKVAIRLTPGAAGVFEVKLNGKTVFDKKAAGKYPDLPAVKEMKAQLRRRLEE